MTKQELREYIKRSLGHPYVKIELSDDHLNDSIDDTIQKWKNWATENANSEIFFTIQLSAGQAVYDMPLGIINIVNYSEDVGYAGGVNQLFTIENYMYNLGYLNPHNGNSKGNLITYHLALNFIDMFKRYKVNKYTYRYHKFNNTLELIPAPSTTSNQKYVLVRAYMLRGAETTFSPYVSGWSEEVLNQQFYDEKWVKDYASALVKKRLGYIRRKFSNFDGLGNTGISLDGDSLLKEAKEEIENLEERLHSEESHEGYGIIVG